MDMNISLDMDFLENLLYGDQTNVALSSSTEYQQEVNYNVDECLQQQCFEAAQPTEGMADTFTSTTNWISTEDPAFTSYTEDLDSILESLDVSSTCPMQSASVPIPYMADKLSGPRCEPAATVHDRLSNSPILRYDISPQNELDNMQVLRPAAYTSILTIGSIENQQEQVVSIQDQQQQGHQIQRVQQQEQLPLVDSNNCNPPNLSSHNNSSPGISENEKIKCNVCGKPFKKTSYLRQHENAYHSGERPFRCSTCGKRFSNESELCTHQQKHEDINKQHSCEFCGKRCNYKRDLKRHRFIHSDKKPFYCQYCKKPFVRKDHLERHEITHQKMGLKIGLRSKY